MFSQSGHWFSGPNIRQNNKLERVKQLQLNVTRSQRGSLKNRFMDKERLEAPYSPELQSISACVRPLHIRHMGFAQTIV